MASDSTLTEASLKLPTHEKDPTQLEWDSFLDHSDTPNVRIVLENFDLKAPRADLVAIRPIKRGDEFLINYHDHEDRMYKAQPCST
jgi:hypothetical protein